MTEAELEDSLIKIIPSTYENDQCTIALEPSTAEVYIIILCMIIHLETCIPTFNYRLEHQILISGSYHLKK